MNIQIVNFYVLCIIAALYLNGCADNRAGSRPASTIAVNILDEMDKEEQQQSSVSESNAGNNMEEHFLEDLFSENETAEQDAESSEELRQKIEESRSTILDYMELLQGAQDITELYDFIEERVEETIPQDADQLVSGLIGFAGSDRNINYEKLIPKLEYFTKGMRIFITMMDKEQQEPTIDGNTILVSLNELLERSVELEIYLNIYKDNPASKYVYNMYIQFMTAAITGGCDQKNGKNNIYEDSATGVINSHALEEYSDVSSSNENTITAGIVNEYLKKLNQSGNVVDDNIVDFYNSLYMYITQEFPM